MPLHKPIKYPLMGVNFPLIISVRSAGSTIEPCCPAPYPLPKGAGEFGCAYILYPFAADAECTIPPSLLPPFGAAPDKFPTCRDKQG